MDTPTGLISIYNEYGHKAENKTFDRDLEVKILGDTMEQLIVG